MKQVHLPKRASFDGKYPSIIKDLKAKIKAGDYIDVLPGVQQLASFYKVTPMTVNKAVNVLAKEGFVYRIPKKGTFVSSEIKETPKTGSGQIGLTWDLRTESNATVTAIQDYVLEKGGLLTLYNINEYNQDPLKEKMFLKKAQRESFQGVIILPTPKKPLNTEVYKSLRESGTKVVLLAPYKENMQDETTFFYDHYHAGYMSAAKIAMAGYKNVCMAKKIFHLAFQLMKKGIVQAAKDFDLVLLDDINEIDMPDINRFPLRTGIISTQNSVGYNVYDWIKSSKLEFGKDIGLCSRLYSPHPEYPKISRIAASDEELLKAAIDHIFDDNIASTETVNELFKFKYEEHGTVAKV